MIVGFTGTRHGMTPEQRRALGSTLKSMGPFEFHHGDCIGADKQAHYIASALYSTIVVHPPTDEKHRAWVSGVTISVPPAPYLQRNHHIVDACDLLIATPAQEHDVLRSGTWSTIRYARTQHKSVLIIFPDGAVERRN